MPLCLSSASSITLPGAILLSTRKEHVSETFMFGDDTKSAIIELQQEQALQDRECQSSRGYKGHQTAFWRLQGLS